VDLNGLWLPRHDPHPIGPSPRVGHSSADRGPGPTGEDSRRIVSLNIAQAALTKVRVACLLSGVAGVMTALSLFELLPQGARLTSTREAAWAFMGGAVVMGVILEALEVVGLG
jgi:hypothetical protein